MLNMIKIQLPLWKHWFFLFLFFGLIFGVATFGVSAPTFAHDELVATGPAQDQDVKTAPREIRLEFSAAPLNLDTGNEIVILDSEGKNWAANKGQKTENRSVIQPLKSGMPDGYYQVRWRVVSSDGHPISSYYNFGVGNLSGKSPAEKPSLKEKEAPANQSSKSTLEDESFTGASSAQDTPQWGSILFIIGGILILFVGGGLFIYFMKRSAEASSKGSHRTNQDFNQMQMNEYGSVKQEVQ